MLLHNSRSRRLLALAITLVLAGSAPLSACKAPQSFGERHDIILRADAGLWAEVDSLVLTSLERRVFTTRPERTFEITFVAVDDPAWTDLRIWQQVLVLGTREDEVVRRLLDAAGESEATAPALVQARDIWARAQLVTAVLLPETGGAEALRPLLPQLFERLKAGYDEWVIQRMYTSGLNDSLKAELAGLGFTLDLPNVYLQVREDSVFRFANPYRQGDSDLLRSLLITWRSGIEAIGPEALRAWRQEIAETRYAPPQDIQVEHQRSAAIEVDGRAGLELRGVWQDRAEFPAAGPFITRAISCPDQNRTYYIDAWLFAPGRDKYPYLRQLEILLDSFRCVEPSARSTPASAGAGVPTG